MADLHDDINKLVEQRLAIALETGEVLNLPDLASEMAESLADLILNGATVEEQPKLIAFTFARLGHFLIEKGEGGGRLQ